jgi:hypothetical protein
MQSKHVAPFNASAGGPSLNGEQVSMRVQFVMRARNGFARIVGQGCACSTRGFPDMLHAIPIFRPFS